jgi:O-antigen ligase
MWRWDENVPIDYAGDKEVHNTLLEILNSYGVIGLCLFLSGCIVQVVRSRFRTGDWVLFLPIFLYNMSHNGFRFRLMWVALAFSLIIYAKRKEIVT